MNFPTCDLCGAVSLDVKPGLAEYPDPDASSGRVRFHSVMRCSNHAECEERVLENGEDWPLTRSVRDD